MHIAYIYVHISIIQRMFIWCDLFICGTDIADCLYLVARMYIHTYLHQHIRTHKYTVTQACMLAYVLTMFLPRSGCVGRVLLGPCRQAPLAGVILGLSFLFNTIFCTNATHGAQHTSTEGLVYWFFAMLMFNKASAHTYKHTYKHAHLHRGSKQLLNMFHTTRNARVFFF